MDSDATALPTPEELATEIHRMIVANNGLLHPQYFKDVVAMKIREDRKRCARIAHTTLGPLWHADTATEITKRILATLGEEFGDA